MHTGYIKTFTINLLFICCIFLCSCFSFQNRDSDGHVVSHHFGYMRVKVPPSVCVGTQEEFAVNDVRTWGIRIQKGVSLGYTGERNEYIPLDGRLVIRVTNENQMEKVLNVLTKLEKEGLCVTVDKNE